MMKGNAKFPLEFAKIKIIFFSSNFIDSLNSIHELWMSVEAFPAVHFS